MTDDEIIEVCAAANYDVVSISRSSSVLVLMRCPCGRIERAETTGQFDRGRFEVALKEHTEALNVQHHL